MNMRSKRRLFPLSAVVPFAGILLATLAVRMIIGILSGGDPIAGVMRYRPFVEAVRVIPAVLAMLAIEYGSILIVFILFAKYFPATGMAKGVVFGACFGLIWFYGMPEAAFALGTSLSHEILFGLSEIPAIVLLGLLAGKYFAKDERSSARDGRSRSPIRVTDISTAALIALFLGAGRFLSYAVGGVEPAWRQLPYISWTIGFGIVVGIVYLVIGRRLPGNVVQKALIFGFVVFGLNWMLFNLVVPYLFIVSASDVLHHFVLRVILDCCYVSGAIAFAVFPERMHSSRVG